MVLLLQNLATAALGDSTRSTAVKTALLLLTVLLLMSYVLHRTRDIASAKELRYKMSHAIASAPSADKVVHIADRPINSSPSAITKVPATATKYKAMAAQATSTDRNTWPRFIVN